MSILITGGAGFVGRHTAKLFHDSGLEVVVLDNLSTGRREDKDSGFFIEGDIADTSLVRRILRDHDVTAVIHLAASANVGDSIANPAAYYANNVGGTAALVHAMIAEDVLQLLFSSSCSVYGNAASSAVREDERAHPISPYGESKLNSENSLSFYEQEHGLHWVALRYFNVAGAEGALGEELAESRRVIPRAIHAATGGGPPLRIFGSHFDTPDGSSVRDFVHVSDVAQANLLALRYVEQRRPAIVANIAAGIGISVLQIVAEVARQTGHAVPHCFEQAQPGDPACAIADISRSRELLGLQLRQSSLQQIVASMLHCSTLRAGLK